MKKVLKWFGIAFVVLIAIGVVAGMNEDETTTAPDTKEVTSTVDSEEKDEVVETSAKSDTTKKEEEPKKEKTEEKSDKPKFTLAQENAIRKAESYINMTAFSRIGLIEQLEFEGFPKEDATFAVDNINVDWNEQASLKAESYLDLTAFSKESLAEQLEFEGFTAEQIQHGVKSVGY